MKDKIISLKKFILDIIFPPLCVSCRSNLKSKKEKEISLCNQCKNKIKINLTATQLKINDKKYYLLSPTSYKNQIVKNIIHALKYKKIQSASITIHQKIIKPSISKIKNKLKNKTWIIIPVPLHKIKMKQRGLNQSTLIAKSIQEELKRYNIKSKVLNKTLIKEKRTKSQAKLKEKDRERNVKNSFKIIEKDKIKEKNIILIDDVFTTGSTIKECINTINKAKPSKLITFTVSKT